jgi:hypothetical protein
VSPRARSILILAALTLALRAPGFFRPIMDIDEGSYAAIACRMLDGGLPYRDGVENKFPGIFYVYRAIFALFGRYNMVAVHAAVGAFALATALVLGAIARRLADSARAAWLTALFYTVFSTAYYPKMQAGNTEMFLVLPASLAVLAFVEAPRRRWLYLVAGLLAGVGTLLKQVAASLVGALVAARAVDDLRRRRLTAGAIADAALLGLGWAAALAGCAVYLWRRGILDDAIFWSWTYVFRHYLPSGTADHGFAFNFVTSAIPYLATLAPLVVPAVARAREARLLPIWLWLASAFGAALIGGRMYGHYFLMTLPAWSVLGGIGADRWLEARPGDARRLGGAVAFVAVGFFVYACVFEAATESFWRPSPNYVEAADWVRARSTADERIFVWGWFPPLYVRADRCPSTRFVYTHVLAGAAASGAEARGHSVPEGWQMLARDLEADPPRFVLDTSHGDYSFTQNAMERFPLLRQFVASRYQLAAEVAGVRIYQRK